MGENSNVLFTDHTWNPWQGCSKVRLGCAHCYMYREKKSYGQNPAVVVRSKTTFNSPLKWKDPARVFTCSWSDFFIKEADPWRPEAWDIIRRTPHLTYQIITKRIENIPDRLPPDWGHGWPHVWLIATIEHSQYLSVLRDFVEIPAFLYGVIVEPILSPVNLELNRYPKIEWVICGGETGPEARVPNPQWLRDVRDQCRKFNRKFLFKQWGEWVPRENLPAGYTVKSWDQIGYFDNHGDFIKGRINKGFQHMIRVGKDFPNHILDGQEWLEFPEVS